MCDIHTMAVIDTLTELGERIRAARLAHGLSQAELAGRLGVDRSAVVRMEGGERKVSALELVALSEALKVPIAHFVHHSPAAVRSRRTTLDEVAQPVERIRFRVDALLEAHLRDADSLRQWGYLAARPDVPTGTVDSEGAARRLATEVRAFVGRQQGPLPSMSTVCELAGLYLLVTDIEADGASLTQEPGFGVSVIGGGAPAGRRRFTAAHELGHHVLGDEYQSDVGVAASRDQREALIDAFASELLLPAEEVRTIWADLQGDAWQRLVVIAAEYRVSWAVAIRTAQAVTAITSGEAASLHARTPQRGDFIAVLGAAPTEDMQPGSTGPCWKSAVVKAYVDAKIAKVRAIEMLHGALTVDELPSVPEPAP